MNPQTPDLFDEPTPPYQKHSATSKAAAGAIMPNQGTLRWQVLEYIRECGARGATDEEIQDGMRMNPSTQRPRRVELHGQGLIAQAEKTRPTRSGRQAAVWVVRDE